jgi:hypothetical protein
MKARDIGLDERTRALVLSDNVRKGTGFFGGLCGFGGSMLQLRRQIRFKARRAAR